MRRTMLVAALLALVLAPTGLARNPGGRNFQGAVFSAGVSGTDAGATASLGSLTPFLDALVRASDDASSTVGPTPAGQSGTLFLFSETEPWVAVNPADPKNVVGAFQEDRWSSGGARNLVAATSFDGGRTWANQPIPGVSVASGGTYQRNRITAHELRGAVKRLRFPTGSAALQQQPRL